MTLQGFIETYGYAAVFLGCFLEGETVLVLAGFAAHLGYLWLPAVMATAAVAGFLGDQTAFFAGRRYGPRLLAWSPRLAAAQPGIRAQLSRHATWVVFMLRFAWGLRIASPIVIGASGLPPLRFALPNAAGAIVWAAAIGSAGYAFGAAFTSVLEHAKRYEEIGFAVLAVLALAFTWFGKVFRRTPPGTDERR
ncbi:MAG TPA: DedA family protein [Casimicrobiaceae bacterium]|jgi:membrane protein DedA with SNARE-associated domain|nr:DedA family protein [Casimicrobiaceae bacterium]